MIKKHGGIVSVKHTFDEAYVYLENNNNLELLTQSGKLFIARAAITKKGNRVIRFFRNNLERTRAYECCWGYYYNCSTSGFGMYAKPLDSAIKP
jgi:hypothetical protein